MSALWVVVVACVLFGCKTDEGASRPDPSPAQAEAMARVDAPAEGSLRPGLSGGPQAALSAGEARVSVSGCAQAGGGDEGDGVRFPVKEEGSRSAAGEPPRVRVSVMGDGVRVSHTLDHACCLTAQVEVMTTEGAVRVREVLSGEPCRCRCQSVIEAAVGLGLGAYVVAVELVTGGQPVEVHREVVEVKPLFERLSRQEEAP